MFALIILVVFGLGMAYFATQNTGLVHITLANYLISAVPLYVIVIGSLLLGIFVSWVIGMAHEISSTLAIHGKDSALKKAHETIESLKEENHTLEIEIARLRGKPNDEPSEEMNKEYEEERIARPSFFHRLRHSLR